MIAGMTSMTGRYGLAALLAASLLAASFLAGPSARAQAPAPDTPPAQLDPRNDPRAESWPKVKCDRWRSAYEQALARFGSKGIGAEFTARHDAFLASGCQAPPDVCPRSAEELNLANVMVIAGMNAGMASTFMPFACRK